MSLSIGDRVRVKKIGIRWDGYEGTITGQKDEAYWVNLGTYDDGVGTLLAEEHLEKAEPLKEKRAEIKDSGERTEFSTGAVRDLHEGKGNMDVMPWIALLRVSRHYENGAKKYGKRNYTKGIPVSSFIDSALRHLAKYEAGYDDEDHLSAAAFNVLGAIMMEEEHPDMCDLPSREGKRKFHYDDENQN